MQPHPERTRNRDHDPGLQRHLDDWYRRSPQAPSPRPRKVPLRRPHQLLLKAPLSPSTVREVRRNRLDGIDGMRCWVDVPEAKRLVLVVCLIRFSLSASMGVILGLMIPPCSPCSPRRTSFRVGPYAYLFSYSIIAHLCHSELSILMNSTLSKRLLFVRRTGKSTLKVQLRNGCVNNDKRVFGV